MGITLLCVFAGRIPFMPPNPSVKAVKAHYKRQRKTENIASNSTKSLVDDRRYRRRVPPAAVRLDVTSLQSLASEAEVESSPPSDACSRRALPPTDTTSAVPKSSDRVGRCRISAQTRRRTSPPIRRGLSSTISEAYNTKRNLLSKTNYFRFFCISGYCCSLGRVRQMLQSSAFVDCWSRIFTDLMLFLARNQQPKRWRESDI